METIITERNVKEKMSDIAKRAALRRADPDLRHIPNENDLRVASENAELMAYHQGQAVGKGDR